METQKIPATANPDWLQLINNNSAGECAIAAIIRRQLFEQRSRGNSSNRVKLAEEIQKMHISAETIAICRKDVIKSAIKLVLDKPEADFEEYHLRLPVCLDSLSSYALFPDDDKSDWNASDLLALYPTWAEFRGYIETFLESHFGYVYRWTDVEQFAILSEMLGRPIIILSKTIHGDIVETRRFGFPGDDPFLFLYESLRTRGHGLRNHFEPIIPLVSDAHNRLHSVSKDLLDKSSTENLDMTFVCLECESKTGPEIVNFTIPPTIFESVRLYVSSMESHERHIQTSKLLESQYVSAYAAAVGSTPFKAISVNIGGISTEVTRLPLDVDQPGGRVCFVSENTKLFPALFGYNCVTAFARNQKSVLTDKLYRTPKLYYDPEQGNYILVLLFLRRDRCPNKPIWSVIVKFDVRYNDAVMEVSKDSSTYSEFQIFECFCEETRSSIDDLFRNTLGLFFSKLGMIFTGNSMSADRFLGQNNYPEGMRQANKRIFYDPSEGPNKKAKENPKAVVTPKKLETPKKNFKAGTPVKLPTAIGGPVMMFVGMVYASDEQRKKCRPNDQANRDFLRIQKVIDANPGSTIITSDKDHGSNWGPNHITHAWSNKQRMLKCEGFQELVSTRILINELTFDGSRMPNQYFNQSFGDSVFSSCLPGLYEMGLLADNVKIFIPAFKAALEKLERTKPSWSQYFSSKLVRDKETSLYATKNLVTMVISEESRNGFIQLTLLPEWRSQDVEFSSPITSPEQPAAAAAKKEQQPAAKKEQQPAAKKEQQPAAKKEQQPAAQKEQQPAAQKEQQPAAQKEQQPEAQKEQEFRERNEIQRQLLQIHEREAVLMEREVQRKLQEIYARETVAAAAEKELHERETAVAAAETLLHNVQPPLAQQQFAQPPLAQQQFAQHPVAQQQFAQQQFAQQQFAQQQFAQPPLAQQQFAQPPLAQQQFAQQQFAQQPFAQQPFAQQQFAQPPFAQQQFAQQPFAQQQFAQQQFAQPQFPQPPSVFQQPASQHLDSRSDPRVKVALINMLPFL